MQSDLPLDIEGDHIRARHVLEQGDKAYCAVSWADSELAVPMRLTLISTPAAKYRIAKHIRYILYLLLLAKSGERLLGWDADHRRTRLCDRGPSFSLDHGPELCGW